MSVAFPAHGNHRPSGLLLKSRGHFTKSSHRETKSFSAHGVPPEIISDNQQPLDAFDSKGHVHRLVSTRFDLNPVARANGRGRLSRANRIGPFRNTGFWKPQPDVLRRPQLSVCPDYTDIPAGERVKLRLSRQDFLRQRQSVFVACRHRHTTRAHSTLR